MGLFDAISRKGKEKKNDSPNNDEKILKVHKYTQSPRFNGFKRLKLVTYGSDSVKKGIDALKIPNPKYVAPKDKVKAFFDSNENLSEVPEFLFDLKGKTIEIRQVKLNAFVDDYNLCLQVFVDNNHIGTYFVHDKSEKAFYDAFDSNKVENVHVRFEQSFVIGEEKKKTTVETQYKSYLFVKIKE